MAQLRVLTGFTGAADHEVEEVAGAVSAGLYANATIYPAPPITQAALNAALVAFQEAQATQDSKGTQGTAEKDQKRDALIALLRPLALYVQTVIQSKDAYGLSELLLSGFEAVSTSQAQYPLVAPIILGINNTGEGSVTVKLKPSPGARMYEVQKKLDGTVEFTTAGLFQSTRGMVVTGLTPGGAYAFRARALGGLTGHSEWSDAVSKRSL